MIAAMIESARSAAFYASALAAQGDADLAEAASSAKAFCSDTFFHCAAENIQVRPSCWRHASWPTAAIPPAGHRSSRS